MRRFLVPLALGLLLVASAVPVAWAQDRRGNDDGDNDRNEDRKPAGIGAFRLAPATGEVTGDHVSFRYTMSTIDDVRVGGVKVFDVAIQGSADGGAAPRAKAEGAQVRIETRVYDLRVHDNPEAVTKIETDGTIALTLAPGATAAFDDGHVEFVLGNLTGVVRGDDLRLDGSTVRAAHRLLVHVNEPNGNFDVHRQEIGKAIGQGQVGVEASFNQGSQGEHDVQEDVVSYGNVTLRTLKAERGNLTIEVDGHGLDGRVLVLNVDGRVLGAQRSDDLSVLFDDAAIAHAASLEDVLDPDDDGLRAEYYVVFDPAQEAFQLIVSVPHYSLHTLSVTTVLAQVSPGVVVGVLAGVALLVPSALVLFRRR